jgi:hypothetical protein
VQQPPQKKKEKVKESNKQKDFQADLTKWFAPAMSEFEPSLDQICSDDIP